MNRCWYCTFPNDIPVLFSHPYYIIIELPDKLMCVFRPHGDITGCKPCIIERMKKSFRLKAMDYGLQYREIKESWESGHLHYIIDK